MDDEISYGWVCQPIGDGLGQYVEGAKIIDLYQEHAVLQLFLQIRLIRLILVIRCKCYQSIHVWRWMLWFIKVNFN